MDCPLMCISYRPLQTEIGRAASAREEIFSSMNSGYSDRTNNVDGAEAGFGYPTMQYSN